MQETERIASDDPPRVDAPIVAEILTVAAPTLDIIEVDVVEDEADAIEETEVVEVVVPDHLKMHRCGVPNALLQKKELVRYLTDHGIGVEERKLMGEFSPKERSLYEVYSVATRHRRVPKQHFIAAFRLWYHGHVLYPKIEKDLAEMRVD